MRRQYWLFSCLILLLMLIQILKNPYPPTGSGGGVALFMESEWLERLFVLCVLLFLINIILSIEVRLNKNPQADDRRFLLSTILSLITFFGMAGIFYLIVQKRRDAFQEILLLINPVPPQGTPASPPAPTAVTGVNTILVGFLLAALGLFLLSAIVRRTQRSRRVVPAPQSNMKSPMALETFDDPRRMIIAYYRHACHLLSLRGFASQKHQTPRQFENVVGTPYRKPLSSLTPLFEEAKYSNHPQTENKREEARRHYEEIRGEGDGG